MRRTLNLAVALAAALALAACAGTMPEQAPAVAQPAAPAVTAGSLTIRDPWLRPASPDAPASTAMPDATPAPAGGHGMAPMVTTGAYMTIANGGAEPDALLGVTAPPGLAEAVELHTVIEEGGMMRMRPVEQIEVPANGEVALKPGGFHIMFIGVRRELRAGDTVALSLEFARAGAVEVTAVVRPANPMP
ncbi:MAG TPA: copper chaperone PCu(A)C [Chloroflexaceae bacterium]|nr:copper chaperone PCu(A)C [Chloroflexaceae bacterium]